MVWLPLYFPLHVTLLYLWSSFAVEIHLLFSNFSSLFYMEFLSWFSFWWECVEFMHASLHVLSCVHLHSICSSIQLHWTLVLSLAKPFLAFKLYSLRLINFQLNNHRVLVSFMQMMLSLLLFYVLELVHVLELLPCQQLTQWTWFVVG